MYYYLKRETNKCFSFPFHSLFSDLITVLLCSTGFDDFSFFLNHENIYFFSFSTLTFFSFLTFSFLTFSFLIFIGCIVVSELLLSYSSVSLFFCFGSLLNNFLNLFSLTGLTFFKAESSTSTDSPKFTFSFCSSTLA